MPLTAAQKSHRKARRLWVKALESGEIKHSTGVLQGDRGFCCLGVACVVAEKHGVKIRRNGKIIGTTLSAQEDVAKWLGLCQFNGRFDGGNLTIINDEAKRNPFKKIAKIIASEPEGLFVD